MALRTSRTVSAWHELDCVSGIQHVVSSTANPKMTRGWGGPLFIWRAQVGTTPSELRKLVVPMREVRKLCANYAQTMRELVVPVRVNVDTDGHAFVNYS